MDEGEGMEQAAPEVVPLGPEEVYRAIAGAMSVAADVRGPAELALRTWEGDAAPGFIQSLLRIVEQADIDEVGNGAISHFLVAVSPRHCHFRKLEHLFQ